MSAQPTLFDLQTPRRRQGAASTTRRGTVLATVGEDPAAASTTQPAPGVWVLEFPAPAALMSVNTGKHWRITSPVKKAWREAMYTHAQAAKLPKGLARIRVDIELRFPTRGTRDASNYHHYVAKPCVDALGRSRLYQIRKGTRAGQWVSEPGYGVIADDNPKKYLHCEDCPHLRVSDLVGARPYGAVVVTITDLSVAATTGDHQ